MTRSGRGRNAAVLLAGTVAVASAAAYLSGGAVPIATYRSDDGRERVELVGRTRWQRLFLGGDDLPGAARLIGADGKVVTTSPVMELSGEGEVFWTRTGVQIGSSAIYDRQADRWTIVQ